MILFDNKNEEETQNRRRICLALCKKQENIQPQQTLLAKPKHSKTTLLEPEPKMKKSKGGDTKILI